MAIKIADIPAREFVLSGNGSCASCPSMLGLRIASKAIGSNAIMVLTPSCTVASMGATPNTAFDYPSLNVTFASAGSSASGIVYSLEAQQQKGRLEGEMPTVFNWVGDGGTYDIGFQALSAAAERNDNYIHFCYNNEVYSNTGVQRSGATPIHAKTTTTPSGKTENKKNMPVLMLDHNIPYAATASLAYPADLYEKVLKAKSIKGFKYIEIFAPCYPSWKFESKDMIRLSRLAVQSGLQLLWEAENGEITGFQGSSKGIVEGLAPRKGLEEYLALQGRFRHMKSEEQKKRLIDDLTTGIERELHFFRRRTQA